MAIRNIVKEGDEVLRREQEVKEINDKIRELLRI